MKLRFTILIFLVFQLTLAVLPAQMTEDLKQFLWQKDFSNLINNYAEETITLQAEGLWQKQLADRTYREETGWRLQLFAGSFKENARAAAADITSLHLDSVYVLEENGLFKVQLGNFQERLAAEKMLDQLRFNGISNAWIVQTTIHVPKDTTDQKVITDPSLENLDYPPLIYTIQLFVTRDAAKADAVLQSLKSKIGREGWVIRSGDFWKVVVGSFNEEAAARQFLNMLRDSGYSDAWLTQVDSRQE